MAAIPFRTSFAYPAVIVLVVGLFAGCSQIASSLYDYVMDGSDNSTAFIEIDASVGEDGSISVDFSRLDTGPQVATRRPSRGRVEVHAGFEVFLSTTSPVDGLRRALTIFDNREQSLTVYRVGDSLSQYNLPPAIDPTISTYIDPLSPRRVTLDEDHLSAANAASASTVYVVVRSLTVYQDVDVWDWYNGTDYPDNAPSSDTRPTVLVSGIGRSRPLSPGAAE